MNLVTFKLAVGTGLCTILTVIFTPVLVYDYQQRL